MMPIDFKKRAVLYKNELLNNVLPFWLKHSKDSEFGGYFSCLDVDGRVYDKDKFLWLQGRQVWTFAMLYNTVESKKEWLEFALHGAEFLIKNGRDQEGNWYFSLNQKGQPLIQPYNIFSDCFASMAFGQLYKATQDDTHLKIARDTFENILNRQDNPKGKYAKAYPGTRNLQGFSLPMILCNLVLEIEHILDPKMVKEVIDTGIDTVMNKFYQPELGLIVENINADGSLSDSFDGRLINPGHGLEAMWFIMDLAERTNRPELIEKAVQISLQILDYGWDREHGGIFYFMDRKGNPPQQLEWDQKLWWVHIEALIAVLKGYLHTGDEKCLEWSEKLHDYIWDHFVDTENGEWLGYLTRQGEPLLSLKGGKWKGCFHVPRGVYQAWQIAEKLGKK